MKKNLKKIEILFFVILNIVLSITPILLLTYTISDWLIVNVNHINPIINDWFYFLYLLILWPLLIIFKICLFPAIFKLKKLFPCTNNFFILLKTHHSFKYKFIIGIIFFDIFTNILSHIITAKSLDIYDLIYVDIVNLFFGGGVWVCYVSLLVWLDTPKDYFKNTKQK